MKRLIITEEEKRNILELYNIIKEQKKKKDKTPYDDSIQLDKIFKINGNLCDDNEKHHLTNWYDYSIRNYDIDIVCDSDKIKIITNYLSDSDENELEFIFYFKRTENKISKLDFNKFESMLYILNEKQYNLLDEWEEKHLSIFDTEKYKTKVTIIMNETPNSYTINYEILYNDGVYYKLDKNYKANTDEKSYDYKIVNNDIVIKDIDLVSKSKKDDTKKDDTKKDDTKKDDTKKDDTKSNTNDIVITNFDRKYNYKKTNEDYFFQLKSDAINNPNNWTKADGSAKIAIAYKVFGEKNTCVFPNEVCPGFNGVKWSDPNNTDKNVDVNERIGFCSKKYCLVKFIQDAINGINKNKNLGLPELKIDGKFGLDTESNLYQITKNFTTSKEHIHKLYLDSK